MKRLIILFAAVLFSSVCFSQNAYEITIEVDGLKDSEAYLSYYYGKGQYYRDTAKIDSKGRMVFSGKDSLEHGMYSLVHKKSKVFDFLVDNQEFSLKTDTLSSAQNMKVKGSTENQLFFDYLAFLKKKQDEAKRLKGEMQSAGTDEKSKIEAQMAELDQEVRGYIKNLHDQNKGSFTSNFIKALERPQVPEPPKNEDGSVDSTFAFRYFKSHFFDDFDFSDERLLRTSTFHEKVMYYMDKLTLQDPDSVIKSVDYILSLAEQNPVLFKYALTTLTSKYERAEQMGMDAVFVHLAKNYFMEGKADWFSDKQLEKLKERAMALDPLLIGKKAPNIIVKDTAQEKILQLYDVKADFTIVYIWSPDCGHCKVSTPKLKKLYDQYKSKGVEVFAVGNEFENKEWLKFIKKHDLNWINGSDGGDFRSNFRTLYDVYSTPQTYLLDKDKTILSKKMSVESLDDILNYFLEKSKQQNPTGNEK